MVVCVNPPFGFVVVCVGVMVGVGAFAFAMCIKGADVTSATATIMAAAIIIAFVSIKDYYKICSIRR